MPPKRKLLSRERRAVVPPVDSDASGTYSSTGAVQPDSESDNVDAKLVSKRFRRSHQAVEGMSNRLTSPSKDLPVIKDSRTGDVASPARAKKGVKKPKYDFSTDAASPYPKWPAPTQSEVETVFRLLEDKHGKIEMSQSKPSLGLLVEGCNDDDPALIDAVIRARLSAGTNDMNASRAFIGILNTFGRRTSESGTGIVDWEAVRKAPLEDVYEAIKTGGMGNVKSRSVKGILDMVHEENVARQKEGKIASDLQGIHLLSLEYMRGLSKDEAFQKFITYPGVGPKTAACVISICMQHSSFAVDTHVYRICSWLGWVPPGADRDGMFAHLETKIPDHLKFDLHYLMIRHGRSCGRCRGNTSSTGKDWKAADCPLEGLVKRKGSRKGEK